MGTSSHYNRMWTMPWGSMSMTPISSLMIDSIDRVCDCQRSHVESLISVELETGICVNHDSTINLDCVRSLLQITPGT